MLNQSITTLKNYDKNAKKILFDGKGIVEEKIKNNSESVNAERRSRSRAIKMVNEDNFQAAIEHTKEAVKTLNDLNK
jgi:hypothetical protein